MLALTALDAATHLTRRTAEGLPGQGRARPRRRRARSAWPGWCARAARPATASRRRWSRASASTTSSSSTRCPTPADLATPWRRLARPFNFADDGVRVIRDLPYSEAGRRGHLDIYLPAGEDAITGRARPAAGPRRRVVGRRQGAPGPPADEPDGRQGLGLRGDQLPPLPARRVAGAHRRRQARHRLGQGATSPTTAATPTTSPSPAARPAVTSPPWPP